MEISSATSGAAIVVVFFCETKRFCLYFDTAHVARLGVIYLIICFTGVLLSHGKKFTSNVLSRYPSPISAFWFTSPRCAKLFFIR